MQSQGDFDEAMIRAYFRLVLPQDIDGCIELRVLDATWKGSRIVRAEGYSSVYAGYFDDEDKFVEECRRIDGANVFASVSPLRRELKARSNNRLRKATAAAKDEDVSEIRYTRIDFDSNRPAGISATDGELLRAQELLASVLDAEPEVKASAIIGRSGNGAMALVNLGSIENSEENRRAITEFHKRLGRKHVSDGAHIDPDAGNPSRGIPVPGMCKRKGDAIEGRPHRLALLDVDGLERPPFDLHAWLDRNPAPAIARPPLPRPANGNSSDPLEAYALKALQAELDAVANSGEGGRNRQLNTSAYSVGQLVGAGALDESMAISQLIGAARASSSPLPEREIEATVRKGVADGMANPRDLSHLVSRASPMRMAVGSVERTARISPPSQRGPRLSVVRPDDEAPAEDRGDGGRLEPTPGVLETCDDPFRLARSNINERYSHADRIRIVRHQEEYHVYDDGCYKVMPDEAVGNELTLHIKSQFDEDYLTEIEAYRRKVAEYERQKKEGDESKKVAPKPPVARKVTSKIRNDALGAMKALTAIDHRLTQPCWLSEPEKKPSPFEIMPTRDSLVDLSSLEIGKDGSIDLGDILCYEPTPDLFSRYVLDYRFDPSAPPPQRWIAFLNEVFPDDPSSQRELQKWFGYLLTPDTSQQKMLYLIGQTRSGKGTILRVLSRLIGESNVTSPALMELGGQFGLSECLGKMVLLLSDARIAGNDGSLALMQERLLNIAGEDPVSINRKNLAPLTVRLPMRIVIAANMVPAFRDPSGAFRTRMRPLHFTRSFEGREDPDLFDGKLVPEMPGILNWAIAGKAMLRHDGQFFVPETARDLVKQLEHSNPPVLFLEECCDLSDVEAKESKEDVFTAYKWWAEKTNHQRMSQSNFGKNFLTAAPSVKAGDDIKITISDDFNGNKRRVNAYKGVQILDHARRASQEWARLLEGRRKGPG